jgi:peptidylprolyl isomerase
MNIKMKNHFSCNFIKKHMSGNVYFDISFDNEKAERVEFELYDHVVPKTAENFRLLCTGARWTKENKLWYQGSEIYRVGSKFFIHGGDLDNHNKSADGTQFDDENFLLHHDMPYLLTMMNSGPNTNGSQFLIILCPSPWYDGKNVVFGRAISGTHVLDKISKMSDYHEYTPSKRVVIQKSGVLLT